MVCILHLILAVVWIVVGDKNSTNVYRYVSPPSCRKDVANIKVYGQQYVSTKSACAIACSANTPRCVGFNYIEVNSGEDSCEYVDAKSDENSTNLVYRHGYRYFEQLEMSEQQVTCSRSTPYPVYTYVPISLSHAAATAHCRENGAHLATAETRKKLMDLHAFWQQVPGSVDKIWLGADDIAQDGDWRWNAANGDPVDYSEWHPSEPNGGAGENCMELYSDGTWNDKSCSNTRSFLCEG
ncbi:C-type lectin domain family 3 member A-like [Lingula anatina]|uniref:C-type lectin domain family 3 member A-like n=1 Tax=Lingula anatina TaxID=7574 RepID=A0A1S3IZ38_LINAN|nr:C-type lectin domain family 3 member A-like [Lingula anatina]|eukprot:XP_013403251.1 C-type lectin domain family 3 member A-like [Lingula anatina]